MGKSRGFASTYGRGLATAPPPILHSSFGAFSADSWAAAEAAAVIARATRNSFMGFMSFTREKRAGRRTARPTPAP
jgi:hypothetical protein